MLIIRGGFNMQKRSSFSGKLVTFTCPLPDYFQDVLARLGPPVG